MTIRVLLIVALVFVAAGCKTPSKKAKNPTPSPKQMQDQSGDMAFEAFVGRLRQAVATHDVNTLAAMMTPNFGYRMDLPGAGPEVVLQYWDQSNTWPDMLAILQQNFVPNGNYMVAPPQFVADPQYHGWRAGIRLVNGSWKFAYFVKD